MDPIARIKNDRAEARKLEDPNADICFLALADAEGQPSVRTLVLRDISNNSFTLFMNQSSPKWKLLNAGGRWEFLLWYQSMQRQYRVSGTFAPLDSDFVRQNWRRRPAGSKYLDILYEFTADQSSAIESREHLVREITRIRNEHSVDDMEAPQKVAGAELIATRIEMLDLNREDRIHDRQVFTFDGKRWSSQTLIP
ncbi:MAG TPA: pyridoxamine 5'-phosphate oxidase family protein [Pseudomonadales bacterium]|nr:pyridoxamine 5'-phosphate oxidase family protein [Pseudomonadales bacterium]